MNFSKELSICNRAIDSEHQRVHGLIEQIASSIKSRNVAALLETFTLLKDCLSTYFLVEENIAQAVGFDFKQHKKYHQNLLFKFQMIQSDLLSKIQELKEDEEHAYIKSLGDCLELHVLLESKPLEFALREHFYDFKP